MQKSHVLQERAVLQQSKAKLFDLVCNNASQEQWAEWLMVPLEHATAAGDSVLVNDLLAAGASWKAGWSGCHNRTLLCAAVQGGNVEVVEDLLKEGAKADVDVRGGERDRVPLHYAVDNGHEAIVKLLLLSGASSNCKDDKDALPIQIAVSRGYEEIVSMLLLRGTEEQVLHGDGNSLLHVAARKGHASVARALLIAGADPWLRNSRGFSALEVAAGGGHVDVIRVLVQHGSDVTSCNGYGSTALHHAAAGNQPGAVDVLVKFGSSVEARSKSLSTPLCLAARQGSCGALAVLLRHKANVHARRSRGRSPLMIACMNLHLEAADLLLRWGADETIADDKGLFAVQVIGNSVGEGNREGRRQDMNSMRKLLANAPADRAWRRGGSLVLCRAFPQKAWFGLASNQDSDGSMGEVRGVSRSTRATARRKKQRMDASIGTCDNGEGTDSKTTASADSTEGDGRVGSCSIEARVVQLEQGSLFRIIVSFL